MYVVLNQLLLRQLNNLFSFLKSLKKYDFMQFTFISPTTAKLYCCRSNNHNSLMIEGYNMINESFYKGFYGLERETLRIDCHRRLASTPHPFNGNDNITKDYCENQLEIVTPVCDSIDELMDSLEALDKMAREVIAKN